MDYKYIPKKIGKGYLTSIDPLKYAKSGEKIITFNKLSILKKKVPWTAYDVVHVIDGYGDVVDVIEK